MKTFFLTSLSLFLYLSSQAQISANYALDYFMAPYDTLVSAQNLTSGILWEDNGSGGQDFYPGTMPFPFTFGGVSVNDIWVNSNGRLFLNYGGGGTPIDYTIVSGTWLLKDAGLSTPVSPILYKVVGSVGNRIAKYEYRNVGFMPDVDPSGLARANFQIWLYESDNAIEFHYGTISADSSLFDPCFVAGIGIEDLVTGDFTSTLIYGDPTKPDTTHLITEEQLSCIEGIPPFGMVYRLMPPSAVSIDTEQNKGFSLQPNPVVNGQSLHITIKDDYSKINSIKIINVEGKLVTEFNFTSASEYFDIDTEKLPKGIYAVMVSSNLNSYTQKVLIE